MRRKVRRNSVARSLFGAGVLLAGTAGVGTAAGERQYGPTDNLKDGEGVALVRENCLACHDDSYIVSLRLSREAWDETLEVMLGMGMPPLDPEVRGQVLDYLETVQGLESAEGDGAGGEDSGDAAGFESPWANPLYEPNPLDWNRPRSGAPAR